MTKFWRSRRWLIRVLPLSVGFTSVTKIFPSLAGVPDPQPDTSSAEQSSVEKRPSPAQLSKTTDFNCESTGILAKVLYRKPAALYKAMAPSGAFAVNANWEQGQASHWYIEAQRTGEEAVIGGLVNYDETAIQAGFQMFDWGFARQATDGSFERTGNSFHSASFFVAAVARTLLLIEQSVQKKRYARQVQRYILPLHQAAEWMTTPDIWKAGMRHNQPYTHRFYVVAVALGLTSKLTGDSMLMEYAQRSLKTGLALQQPDGQNPEKGGADSSYQMAGVVYAQRWIMNFPQDLLTPKVIDMIGKALNWEASRILPTGKISTLGNTRTAGQERRRTGQIKGVDHRLVFRGFAYWAAVTNDPRWAAIAQKIAKYYYGQTSTPRK